MSKSFRPRSGFTLAEVLVTIAIVAVLAAVLLPVLSGQLRKGDIGRVTADLTSMRTGIEAFLADVRRVPSEVSHLVSAIADSDDDINGDGYPPGLVSRWNGPYIDKDQIADSIATGFGGKIINTIDTITSNGALWAVVNIHGLTAQEFDDIDESLDGQVSSSTGRLRYNGTLTRYLVMPIN